MTFEPRFRRLALALLLACGGAACADATDTPGPDGPQSWITGEAPLLRVGEVDGDPRYLFSRITGARLLLEGAFAVSELGTMSIRVYDQDGGHVVSMGGPGDGPGEFGDVTHLEVSPPDTLLAYDLSAFRLTRYLTDGTLVGTVGIDPEEGYPEAYVGSFSNGDVAVATLVPSPRSGNDVVPDRMVLGRYDIDGSRTATLDTVPGIRRAGGVAVVPFTPFMHAWVLGDSVYVTDGTEPVVAVLGDQGSVAREIRLTLPRPDLDAAWAVLREELAARDRSQWIEDLAPGVASEPVPVLSEAMVDRDGRIWLKHYRPATDAAHLREGPLAGGSWSVVDPEGHVIAEVELPEGFAPMDATGRSVLGVERDALDVERVVAYALVDG